MYSFIQRLRTRKIAQWALTYLAAAWLLFQVLELLADVYAWPPGVLLTVVPLLAVGFLAALVVAWFHGEKGQQRVSGIEIGMLIGILVLAGSAVSLVSAGSGDAVADGSSPKATPPADPSSLAVLPFVNVSADQEQEYFSDGITEELLHALAQVPGLHVPARTSSFAFKGEGAPIQEIAAALGVAHVLEGSVRTAGPADHRTVRITAQLIDASTGGHIWSETYDRRLSDVFTIQEDIARSIVAALPERLGIEPETTGDLIARSTESIDAYQAYLRALAAFNERRTRTAIEEVNEAVALDPDFPRAHALRAAAYAVAGDSYHLTNDREHAFEEAEKSARRALDLDPSLALAHSSIGLTHDALWEWEIAEAAHRAAVEANPADADARLWYGFHLLHVGRLEEAMDQMRQATALDPLSPTTRRNYALALTVAGRHEDVRREAGVAASLGDEVARVLEGMASALLGDTAAARRAIHGDGPDRTPSPSEAILLAMIGDTARARSALDRHRLANPGETVPSLLAWGYAALGDEARAIALLERAFEGRRDPFLFIVLRGASFDGIREHPRVARLFRRAGL